jgi:hypothetical protein
MPVSGVILGQEIRAVMCVETQGVYTCVRLLFACLQASCATMAWLDACAKLLLQQQHSLEQQLSKFTAVIPGQGLVRHSPQRSDYASHNLPVTPTGGSVSCLQTEPLSLWSPSHACPGQHQHIGCSRARNPASQESGRNVCSVCYMQVSLRHLRESVALLAARLRQHKAAVLLPKALQDLTPQVRLRRQQQPAQLLSVTAGACMRAPLVQLHTAAV